MIFAPNPNGVCADAKDSAFPEGTGNKEYTGRGGGNRWISLRDEEVKMKMA